MFFLKGLLFGMVLQLSIGPVCLAVWHRSIALGFKESLKMVWGVTLVDSFYILAAFLGMDQLFRIKIIRETALIAGAIVLIYFGLKYILAYAGPISSAKGEGKVKEVKRPRPDSLPNSPAMEEVKVRGGRRWEEKMEGRKSAESFALGIRLTLTNPLTVLFWSGVFSTLIASGSLGGLTSTLLYSLGCISSTILFLGLVAAGGSRLSGLLNESFRRIMDFSVGILLILFGIRMAVKGILA